MTPIIPIISDSPVKPVDLGIKLPLEETVSKTRRFSEEVAKFVEADKEEKKVAAAESTRREDILETHDFLIERDYPDISVQRDSVQERRQKLQTQEQKRAKIRKLCCLCRAIYKVFLPCCFSKNTKEKEYSPPLTSAQLQEIERIDRALQKGGLF